MGGEIACSLHVKDQKLRKKWLGLMLVMSLLPTIKNLSLLIMSMSKGIPLGDLNDRILEAGLSLLFFYLMYRCAYKSPGTRLVSIFLVLQPVALLIMLAFYFLAPGAPLMSNVTFILLIIIPLTLLSSLYVLSWKLRKLNKKIQWLEISKSIKIALDRSKGLPELNETFLILKEICPQHKPYLCREYQNYKVKFPSSSK